MFRHQLKSEVVPTLAALPESPSLNDCGEVRRLLEQHTGFGQFRIILPGTVYWSAEAAKIRGSGTGPVVTTLEEAVLGYMPEDRKRIVDAISDALVERKGFRFIARAMRRSGGPQVIETIGDVRLSNGVVSELFGLVRDVSYTVERDAISLSRARLIRHMVEEMPAPVVVLDRALRVTACSVEWARAYGLEGRTAAQGRPLGKLVEVSRETTAAIIEALNGRTAHVGLWFYSDDNRKLRRSCAVIPWQCGTDAAGGVIMVIGGGDTSFASLEIADKALGRTTKSLLQMLEAM